MNLSDLSFDKIRNAAEDAFNQAKPKTETEAKLYEILSHKNWGSSSSLMNEIARETYDYDKFGIISTVMWESLENQRPAAWRVVFKGLTLLEHLIKNGSERCVDDARSHGNSLRALQQFNYYEGTIDRGQGVREKSKQIMEMLADDERVREERMKARKLREKFGGNVASSSSVSNGNYAGYGNNDAQWDSGYGEGGIDAAKANSTRSRNNANVGYSGRYDNDRDTRNANNNNPTAAPNNTPTFATIPPNEDKKTKKKKKKKPDETDETTNKAFQPDLLGFGADSNTPGEQHHDIPQVTAVSDSDPFATSTDNFGDFSSAHNNNSSSVADPFAVPAPINAPVDTFQPFQSSHHQPPANNMLNVMQLQTGMASLSMANHPTGTSMATNMAVPKISKPATSMTSNFASSHNVQHGNEDDDFGDFETAGASSFKSVKPATNTGSSAANSDPLSKLISLDGLSKNDTNKKANKLAQPVIAGTPYQQEKSQIDGGFTSDSFGSTFGGTASSGGASSISMMDPTLMGISGGGAKRSVPMQTGMAPTGMMPGMAPMGMPAGMQPNLGAMGMSTGMTGMGMPSGMTPMGMNPMGMGGMGMSTGIGGMGLSATGMQSSGMGAMPMNMTGTMGGMGNTSQMMGMGMQPVAGNMTPQQQQQAMMMMMMMNQQQQQKQPIGGGGGFGSGYNFSGGNNSFQ